MRNDKDNRPGYLGEFEEIVLLAILRLENDDAYGVTIRREIENQTQRVASVGAVYTTLERLEKKGLITSRQGEATPERGGRAKRYFQVERAGEEALRKAIEIRMRLLKGIERKRLRLRV